MFLASEFKSGGRRVTAAELKNGPIAGVITNAEVVEFEKDGKKERKPSITLDVKGDERQVILNKTNLQQIAAIYGDSSAKWIGKKLGFVYDPTVSFGGQMTGGVRVKFPKDVQPEPDFDIDDDAV